MPVFLFLLALLIAVPLAEIYVLIEVGRSIGAGTTVALVILTAVVGAFLLRWQGLTTLARVQRMLNAGELPAIELVEGLILLVTGALLLTPGFITDVAGFLCLVPPLRRTLAQGMAARMVVRASVHAERHGPGGPQTFDGEFRVEDEPDDKRLE
ncbi:MAG: FxsA family protein [Gammaproteobacteria bacterium]